jgi:hypothetical protein
MVVAAVVVAAHLSHALVGSAFVFTLFAVFRHTGLVDWADRLLGTKHVSRKVVPVALGDHWEGEQMNKRLEFSVINEKVLGLLVIRVSEP